MNASFTWAGMLRLAVASALALGLLLGGCVAGPAKQSAEAQQASQCDRARPTQITFVCVRP